MKWPILLCTLESRTLVGSQVEYCRPLRAISPAPHNTFVCTSESSVQRSAQTVSIVTLKKPSSPRPVRCNLPSRALPGPKFNRNAFTAAPVSRFISPIQTASDYSWHQHQNFQMKMSLRNYHKFDPNFHAFQLNSSHHSIHRNSSHHQIKNCPCEKCQWIMSVQIPQFMSFSLILVFLELTNHFLRFYSCTNYWHRWLFFVDFSITFFHLSFALTLRP